jgi:AraC-like DNA-binding protein
MDAHQDGEPRPSSSVLDRTGGVRAPRGDERSPGSRPADEIAPAPSFQAPPLDTSGWKPQDAFDSWREVLSGAYEVPALESELLSRFHVQADLWNLGGLMVSRVSLATPFRLGRKPRRSRADQTDHYGLLLRLDGNVRVEADGEREQLKPGTPMFVDMAGSQLSNDHDEGTYAMTYVPREMLDEALPYPVNLHGLILRGGAASMLSLHLRNVLQHLPEVDPRQTADITKATVAMIAAAVAPTAATREAARPAVEVTLLRQISRYIELHLTDPGLTPQSICHVFRISRSALYRLFEPLGGVAAFVRERRLIAVRDKLVAEHARPPLHKLAEEYGFSSAAHFSTSFRQMFGHPPSETRFSAVEVAPASAGSSAPSLFTDWLRSLRG